MGKIFPASKQKNQERRTCNVLRSRDSRCQFQGQPHALYPQAWYLLGPQCGAPDQEKSTPIAPPMKLGPTPRDPHLKPSSSPKNQFSKEVNTPLEKAWTNIRRVVGSRWQSDRDARDEQGFDASLDPEALTDLTMALVEACQL